MSEIMNPMQATHIVVGNGPPGCVIVARRPEAPADKRVSTESDRQRGRN